MLSQEIFAFGLSLRLFLVHSQALHLMLILIDILHHAAEVVNVAILQLDLEIERLAHSSSPSHSGKVDGGYGVKLDVDGRFVNEDESLVERIEVSGSSTTGARDRTLVVVAVCLREGGESEERGRERTYVLV